MKKISFFVMFLFVLSGFGIACAQQEVHVINGRNYFCGDSLEVIFPNEPTLTTEFTRKNGWWSDVHTRADKDSILLKVRIKVRNMSNVVYNGLQPASFRLVGYVRGKPVDYYPEVMEPFDYGDWFTYYNWYDKMYYTFTAFPPLHMIDMILVYRIHPFVRDLEMHIFPMANNGTTDQFMDASYGEMELEPCDGIFQFLTIRDEANDLMIRYTR